MTPYLLVPLTTCLVTGALAAAILSRDTAQPVNRLAALLVGSATVWSFFEVLWNTQTDPAVALLLVKASAFGWVWIGPLTLHLFLELTGEGMPLARRSLHYLYVAGVRVPRFGAAACAVQAGVILWTFRRFGYSLLAPGDFASEILETLPDGVALLRLDGAVRGASGAMARLLGQPVRSLVGVGLGERLSEPIDFAGGGEERRCELLASDGRRVPVAVATRLLRDKRGSPLG